jgi:predicted O-linked N-acetylglucosamine transferase (SPINDLY family)
MRFRHTAEFLSRLGVPDLIAKDKVVLVAIAARLGTDPEWRGALSSAIERNKHRLFEDQVPIEALARFLESLPEA